MNIIADSLTLTRGVLVIFILIIGISHDVKSLPTIAVLMIFCWITDVLDGKFSRQSHKPTYLGRFDLVADLGLSISLAICLVLWEFIPLLPAVIILVIAALSLIFFNFLPPENWQWVWSMGYLPYRSAKGTSLGLGHSWGEILLIFINPEGSKRQVREFIGEVRKFFK